MLIGEATWEKELVWGAEAAVKGREIARKGVIAVRASPNAI